MAWYHFSKTAGANASADPLQNWAEGMSPSAVNDSARALLAVSANYRDDVAGGTLTTGTAQNYILQTFSNFTTTAFMSNQLFAFTAHATNTGSPVTMSVDTAMANIPLRSAPNTELLPGTLIQGSPYAAVFNLADGALYLQGYYGNAFNIPLGGMIDFIGSTSPNTSLAVPIGQAISRTTYSKLFALIGTTYGVGDGSTTYNLPDLRGRVTAMLDSSGAVLTSATMSPNGNTLGAIGGAQLSTLGTGNLPAYTPSGGVGVSGSTLCGQSIGAAGGGATVFMVPNSTGNQGNNLNIVGLSLSGSFSGNAQGGTSAPFSNVMPAMALNKLVRVL